MKTERVKDGHEFLPAQQALPAEWNNTQADYPSDSCLHELIEAQVARSPESVALAYEQQQLTYRDMNARANQLARHLRTLGVGPEVCVGICMERSPEMILGLLAILKAGGAYVPLDPAYPKDRLTFMLDDSKVSVLLSQQPLLEVLPTHSARVLFLNSAWWASAKESPENPISDATPENLAYVMYTSGSTGRPKGVQVAHRGLCSLVETQVRTCGVSPGDRVLQFCSLSFDPSIFEIGAAFRVGATLVVAPQRSLFPGPALAQVLHDQAITTIVLPPSVLSPLPDQPFPSLKTLVVGAEPVTAEFVKRWGNARRIFNIYGATETTVFSTIAECSTDGGKPSIGRPIANTRIYLLDSHLHPVPVGVPGELYVGGVGLARGYVNRPDLTAERFIPDPFSRESGARLYRTGDLACYLPNGDIDFLGRVDYQVKVRGHRIEVEEVETVLAEHAGVRQAVVVIREDVAGDKRLVAYVIAKQEQAPVVSELRGWLKAKLPDYMVPSAFVMLTALPLSPNGKVDRKALPPPGVEAYGVREYQQPRGEIETALAEIWAEVLKVERIGRQDNFFELGGHSLLVVGVVERMRRIGLQVDLRALFRAPTLAELAAAVSSQAEMVEVPPSGIPGGCEAITPEMLPLAELRAEEIERIVREVPGGAANIEDIYPLAPLQEGILFHHLIGGEGDPYLLAAQMSFDTRARMDGYLEALQGVIERHDILRTGVVWKGLREPVQVVWRRAVLRVEEVGLDAAVGDVANQLYERFNPRKYRIEVSQAPLLRVHIAQDKANERWVLMLLWHHLAGDHSTLEVMEKEIEAHLVGQAGRLRTPLPFRNLVAQARLGISRGEHETFFRQMLGEVEEPTLPFGLLDVQGDGSGIEGAGILLDVELAWRIRERARKLRVSAASLCHVAWARVLGQVSGREDVVFGTVLLGRMQGGEGSERGMGLFINTLPVRIHVGDESVEASVQRTHILLADLLRHEHASLALAQRCSGVPAPAPLFSALLNYLHSAGATQAPSEEKTQAREGIRMLRTEERTNYPVTLSVDDLGEAFALTAQVEASIGPQRVCELMRTALQSLVGALERTPTTAVRTVEVLPVSEREQVLYKWNETGAEYPREKCIHELFEEQVGRTPEAVAVVYEGEQVTYRELNRRANQLAHYLRKLGVGPEARVGTFLERSPEMIVGLVGILKAGGAYVPVDPTYPADRVAFMLANAGVEVLLAQRRLVKRLPKGAPRIIWLDEFNKRAAGEDLKNPRSGVQPDNLAYVMYTSGSAGTPKGVEIVHRGVVRLLFGVDFARFQETEVFLQLAPISFDASNLEVWGPLLHGGQCVLFTNQGPTTQDLGAVLKKEKVSTLWLTASLFNAVIDEAPEILGNVKQLMVGGEALSPVHVRQALQLLPNSKLINGYGPTESTTFTCCYPIPTSLDGSVSSVPIGRPIANTQVHILDRHLQPVPIQAVGELHIGGDGLARGYLNQPELTAEKFIPNPFSPRPGARLYKTGDLARYLPDGTVEFLGRLDDQVKIRGFRVEPGEIEANLAEHPGVKTAAVIVRDDEPSEKRLVAFVKLRTGFVPSSEDLRAFLKRKLPEYMLPGKLEFVDSLPLTPSGKVDRNKLRALSSLKPAPRDGSSPPRSALEEELAKIWAEVLKLDHVGVRENFFDLGGHSLLAVKLIARIEKHLGEKLTLASIFQAPTIQDLADALSRARSPSVIPGVNPIQPGGSGSPFFCIGAGPLFRPLALRLGNEQPFLGLGLSESEILDLPAPFKLEDIAARLVAKLRKLQPEGPYSLGGWCHDGILAYEVAQQLRAEGQRIALLVLFDACNPAVWRTYSHSKAFSARLHYLARRVRYHLSTLRELPIREVGEHLRDTWHTQIRIFGYKLWGARYKVALRLKGKIPSKFHDFNKIEFVAVQGYEPKPFSGRVVLFLSDSERQNGDQATALSWHDLVRGGLGVHSVPGSHRGMFAEPNVELLAETLRACLREAQAADTMSHFTTA